MIDFKDIKTFSARDRVNLVTVDSLAEPGADPVQDWDDPDFCLLTERIRAAKDNGRPIILSMGAHVIKCGMSRYIIELMKRGYITHVASNGAGSIHDFELCYLGGTSEDVPTAIEDGSFGMWEETGRWMNEAISAGAKNGWGYGEALARFIHAEPDRFPHKDVCVLYQAWLSGIPATYHIAIGTDIIHQHPTADFAAIGKTSGVDFVRICDSVAKMDGGVYMNFGSGVIGPEVFLKALSVSRNLGFPTKDITTANFDLRDLGDYRKDIGGGDPDYYYRPRKNIVNRPTSSGGRGWHFVRDHRISIPSLYKKLVNA